ncbi:putative late blight resistance protein homolog R1B-17 [Lycium ferocissimum]|uniref:putative late blight resistance protein homolog R1B-17 n=1 Tax=Lycium ferocissimum TaxID=112874 RepID=UPI002815EB00|nr:putative late blight resistance protein homolog R1B-17 [Lycium ferocissimum]
MADTEVDFVIDYLTQLLRENTDLIAMIEDDVKSLLGDLKHLKAFLTDASKSRSRSEILKLLVKELIAAVYGAENSIDKFLIEVKLHQEKRRIIKVMDQVTLVRKAKNCSAEIKSIREKLKETKRDTAYGLSMSLQYEDPKRWAPVLKRAPVPEEDDVVGIDEDAAKIITRLCEGSADLKVIPIVGMAGLGKTTLANKIFNDSRVKCAFDYHIWVYVSQFYNRRDRFLDIIDYFTSFTEQYRYVTEDALAEKVRKHLLGRKYLIVLDDIWTIEAWNDIKIVLPDNQNGSGVLLTTRDSTLADRCSNNCPYYLGFLAESECWELLQRKVFHKKTCPPDLEFLGQQIARQCMGLPLAILVIAGALNGRGKTVSEWHRVCQGMREGTSGRYFHLGSYNPVKLSYDCLPFNLKVCFLYCGAFPRGFEIPAWKIVRLWIAEGFIGAQMKINLETVAEEYLEELVSKNLLIVTKRTSNSQIKTCRMHDIVHEFCTLVAREENLFKEIKLGIEQSFPRNQELATFRRLCIDSSVEKFFSTKPYGDSIRSFLCFSSQKEKITMPALEFKTIPRSFPLLRVFDIESISFDDSEIFHKQFIQLYHLRYIALSSDSLNILPKFIGDLWNLQTLIIWTAQETLDIRADICNMPQLRHLHTKASAKLCPSAAAETKNHGALQTLTTIEPESCTEHVFARCQNLKKLGIRGKIANGLGRLILNANKLKYLEKLKLVNDLAGGTLHLPSENILPASLKKVTLSGTMLEWADMVILEKLPALEVLKLKKHAFTGDCWELKDNSFPHLKVLWIEQTDLITWKASNHVFPRLEKLVLRHLDKLNEVPIELAKTGKLQMMKLVKTTTTAVESARKIEAEREETGDTGLKLDISDGN